MSWILLDSVVTGHAKVKGGHIGRERERHYGLATRAVSTRAPEHPCRASEDRSENHIVHATSDFRKILRACGPEGAFVRNSDRGLLRVNAIHELCPWPSPELMMEMRLRAGIDVEYDQGDDLRLRHHTATSTYNSSQGGPGRTS